MSIVKSAIRISSLLRIQPNLVVPALKLHTTVTNLAEKKKKKYRWYHWALDPQSEYDEEGNELVYPSDLDLAMGEYKQELEFRAQGYIDPYGLLPIERGDKGTKIDPIMVPSWDQSRIINCICHENDMNPMSHWLHLGELTRCRCGYWFLLYYEEPVIYFDCPTK